MVKRVDGRRVGVKRIISISTDNDLRCTMDLMNPIIIVPTITLGLLNLITFAMFGIDKGKAKKGASRIPEKVLFSLSIFGGLIGGWVGMVIFRHKTKKASFLVVMSIITINHAIAITIPIYFLYVK